MLFLKNALLVLILTASAPIALVGCLDQRSSLKQQFNQALISISKADIKTFSATIQETPELLQMQDEHGLSLVQYCITFNLTETIPVLNKYPSTHEAADDDLTPLMRAIVQRNNEFVRWLVSANADVNEQSGPEQMTPLMLAVLYNEQVMVRFLLDRGAKTELRDIAGLTAYDFAKYNNYRPIMNLLSNDAS